MNKLELQAQADELQIQLNALTEKIANCKDEPMMFPQKGELYWYYGTQGGIYCEIAFDSNGTLEAYRTEAEAEKAVKIQWAKQRVAHRIAVLNDGWVPDWECLISYKYYVRRIGTGKAVTLGYEYFSAIKSHPDWMYCKSKEIVQQVIEECRNDLLLIFSE